MKISRPIASRAMDFPFVGRFASRGLRLVAIAIAITACVCGLLAYWSAQTERQLEAAIDLKELDAAVIWAWRLDDRILQKMPHNGHAPSWRLPGDAFVAGVFMINCSDPQLDNKLAILDCLRGLRQLSLANASITDAALRHLTNLSHLEWLDLRDTPINDEGLRFLPSFANLESLNLCNTRITDASLPLLAKLKRLTWLNLCGTRITPTGYAKLCEQLPGVRIEIGTESENSVTQLQPAAIQSSPQQMAMGR